YAQGYNQWYISDFGFCGPANKPLNSIYGELSYIAPEVIYEKRYTFASDIYSFAMLMWEISFGWSPFAGYKHSDYDLAMGIVNGMRPKIIPGTPLEYQRLMEQCWDADPEKRPDTVTVRDKIWDMRRQYSQLDDSTNINYSQANSNSSSINSLARNFSKIHIF